MSTLYFIQPHVIARVQDGSFVPKRKQNASYRMGERRNVLSPLNVIRRVIRYEPLVFSNRRAEILQVAEVLNHPQNKLVLVSGPSGRGKTTFIRGVVELMGGGQEQLLWFDVSRHTDFDEVIRFLIDYMTYLCQSLQAETNEKPETLTPDDDAVRVNPISQLDKLLRQAKDFPILLVIDNMEHLVAPDGTIRSRELKDAFNFLLSFANVKLILAGKQLPYADMNPAASAVQSVPLLPLTDEASHETVLAWLPESLHVKLDVLQASLAAMGGEPGLLFVFARLLTQQSHVTAWQDAWAQANEDPVSMLLALCQTLLSPVEKQILGILSLIRHSGTPAMLQTIVSLCDPAAGAAFQFDQLSQSHLRWLLKKGYPPQLVLDKLRRRLTSPDPESVQGERTAEIEAWYQVSDLFLEKLLATVPEAEQVVYHQQLQQFYKTEKDKHVLNRLYSARTKYLQAEAQFHASQVARLKRPRLTPGEVAATYYDPLMTDPASERSPATESLPPSSANDILRTQRAYSGVVMPHLDASRLPWPTFETTSVSEDYEGLDLSDRALYPSSYDMSAIQPVPMPISIQVDSPAANNLHLSDRDMHNLAKLIASYDHATLQKPRTRATIDTVEDASYSLSSSILGPSATPPTESISVDWQTLGDETNDPTEKSVQQALREAMKAQQGHRIAEGLLQLGSLRLGKGQFENAIACFQRALSLLQAQPMPMLQLSLHGALAHAYRTHYRHNDALNHLREIERLMPDTITHPERFAVLAQAYWDEAEIYAYRKQWATAQRAFEKSLALTQVQPAFRAEVLFRQALILDEAGEMTAAIDTYRQSFVVSKELEDYAACSAALYNLASLYFEQGDTAQASDAAETCLGYDSLLGQASDIFRTQMLLSQILEAAKDLPSAYRLAHQAFDTAKSAAHKTQLAKALLRLAHLAEQDEQWTQAVAYYQDVSTLSGDTLSEESRQYIVSKLAALQQQTSK